MTTDHRVAAMTVNERLSHFSLFEEFEDAVLSRDHRSVVAVLLRARLTQDQAHETATVVLEDPGRYGLR